MTLASTKSKNYHIDTLIEEETLRDTNKGCDILGISKHP